MNRILTVIFPLYEGIIEGGAVTATAWCQGRSCKQWEAVAPTFWVLDSLVSAPLFTLPLIPPGGSVVNNGTTDWSCLSGGRSRDKGESPLLTPW